MANKVLSICTGLLLILSGTVFAQSNGNQDRGNRNDTTRVERGKPDTERGNNGRANANGRNGQTGAQNAQAGNENAQARQNMGQGQGNAYGRNKGDLTGREFGQLRSEEARSKVKQEVDELSEVIRQSEAEVETRRIALAEARTRFETIKEEGETSEDELTQKEAVLEEVDRRLQQLEAEIESKKAKVRTILEQVLNQEQPENAAEAPASEQEEEGGREE